jgi:SpoVK/Ycf46/Vps4 family AAA+-type ATPase
MKCLAGLSSEVSRFGEILRQRASKNIKIVLFIEDFSLFLPDFDRSSSFVENEAFKNFEYIMSGMVKYAATHNICIIGSLDIEYTCGFEFTDDANSRIFDAFNSSSFDVLRFYEPDEDTMALIVRDKFRSKGIECDDIVLDTMMSIVLRHTKPTYMNSFVKMMTFTDKAIDYCIALHETPDQDIVSKVLNMFETGFSVL